MSLRANPRSLIAPNFTYSTYPDFYAHLLPGTSPTTLSTSYPAFAWKAWLFRRRSLPRRYEAVWWLTRRYWQSQKNLRTALDELGRHCQISSFCDWYNVNSEAFEQHGGKSLILACGSLSSAIIAGYPEYSWKPWLFRNTPKNLWTDPSMKNQFILWLGDELGPHDWYRISQEIILRNRGKGLLERHECYHDIIMQCFPDTHWLPWKFKSVPNKFWHNRQNRVEYLNWLFHTLGFSCIEDLYQLTQQSFIKNHGSGLLAFYNNSVYRLLTDIYPDMKWMPWKLPLAPKEFWRDPKILTEMITYIENVLQIKNLDEWYRISRPQLASLGVYNAISKSGGLVKILTERYPDHKWNLDLFSISARKRAEQRQLFLIVSELFPGHNVFEEFKHPIMKFASGRRMELDVFVPALSLAFEYQHYSDTGLFGKANVRIDRDLEKKKACDQNNIRLISVPYWLTLCKENILNLIQSGKQ